jgi:hypothetical protein
MTVRAAPRVVEAAVARRTPGHLPWPALLCAVAAAGAAVAVPVATRGQGAGLAVQMAGLALAAAAGYLLDDPASAVTQTVPRPLWRRRSATVVRGLAVLAATWIVLLTLLEWRVGGFSAVPSTIEAAVVALLALAVAALLARRGEPEPGNVVAPAVALVGIGAFLLQPLLGITLFLSADEASAGRLGWWAGVAVGAVLILGATWRDPARRRGSGAGRPGRP